MSAIQLRAIGLILCAVVVFGTGGWLTSAGRPYGVALQTVHKLVALAAVIIIAVTVYEPMRIGAVSTGESIVIWVAGLLVIASFASGAVVSASDSAPFWVLRLHRVVPWFAGVLAAVGVYITAGRV